MKRKLLLAMLLGSVSVVYPTQVTIKNLTKEPVWVRVNYEVRSTLRDKTLEKIWDFLARFDGSRREYPDFKKIQPLSEQKIKFGLFSFGGITKVTFLRVVGQKQITDTARGLYDRVLPLTRKYGNIALVLYGKGLGGGRYGAKYVDGFDEQAQQWEGNISVMGQAIKHTITIPDLEMFIYELGSRAIKLRETGVIELRSWGEAVRVE